MNLRHTRRLPAWISMMVLMLSGCTSQHKALLPDSGPTTLDVYNQHVAGGDSQFESTDTSDNKQWRAILQQPRPDSTWSRTTLQALDVDFQRIPNPELIGYVFPHLTSQGHPVPGYSTRFMLYEKNAYALPGEMPIPAPAETSRVTQGTQP